MYIRYTDDIPSKYVHIMYIQISKNVPGPLYITCIHLYLEMYPLQKNMWTHNKEFKKVAFAPFQASEIQQCLSLCLENRVEPTQNLMQLTLGRDEFGSLFLTFAGVLKPSVSGLGPGGLDSWDPLMKRDCLFRGPNHPPKPPKKTWVETGDGKHGNKQKNCDGGL